MLLAVLLLALRLAAAAQAPAWHSARAVAAATAAATGNNSVVRATAVDAVGNVFLVGTFQNTMVLGSNMLTSIGLSDIFVTKFNPVSNQFVWAQRAGSTDYDQATALAVSGTSIYVAGHFSNSAGFGLTTLTSAGFNDVFVAKLTDMGSTGVFVWAQRAGGTNNEYGNALAVSGTSVYVAGYFGGSAGFGLTALTSVGFNDVFVAKLTDTGPAGSFVWAQRAGGSTDGGYATALAVSGASIYVAGYFGGSAGFGLTTLTSAGIYDVFVAKLTDTGSAGSFVWAQRAGGSGYDYAYALAVSGTSVYVGGGFGSSTVSFGNATLTSAGTDGAFVAKLTDTGPTGSFVWAQRAGTTSYDQARALAVSGTSVYVAGYFTDPTARFGTTTLTNASNAGTYDVFVARLTDAGPTSSFAWAQRAGGTENDYSFALTFGGTNVYVAGNFDGSTASFGTITLTNANPSTSLGFLASLTDATLTATTAATGPRESATLFPNPARRTATLRLPVGTVPAPLVLTDALGRVVRRYPVPAGPEATLDIQALPAGLYLLRGAGPVQRLAVE